MSEFICVDDSCPNCRPRRRVRKRDKETLRMNLAVDLAQVSRPSIKWARDDREPR